MPEYPRPGMGQDEKDQLGQQLHAQRQQELRDTAEANRDTWTPDEKLDGLTQAELADEAERRGFAVGRRASRQALLDTIREVQPEPEEKPKRASRAAKHDEEGGE